MIKIILSVLLIIPSAWGVKLTGTFVDLSDGTFSDISEIPRAMSSYKAMGMDSIYILATAQKPTPFSNCQTNNYVSAVGGQDWEGMYTRVGRFLAEAQSRQMKVVIGLVFSMLACRPFDSDMTNREQDFVMSSELARQFEARFGTIYNSTLLGYYIPNEPALAAGLYIPYVKRMVQAIRTNTASRKIFNSPYLGIASESHWTPQAVAALAKSFLDGTGVNTLLYQDSVGASGTNMGGVPGEFILEDYLQAMVNAAGADAVYSDVELFNRGNASSAAVMRINQQLWQSRMTGGRVAFMAQGQMYPVSIFNAHPQAPRLLAEYQAEYSGIGKRQSFTYSYVGVQPFPPYPDNDLSKLKNNLVGAVRNPADPQWVGILGSPTIEIDLGISKKVDYVAVHTLGFRSWAIGIPQALHLRFSDNKLKWSDWKITQTESEAKNTDGEYVLTSQQPFNARYIQVYFPASNPFVFLSEINITSGVH